MKLKNSMKLASLLLTGAACAFSTQAQGLLPIMGISNNTNAWVNPLSGSPVTGLLPGGSSLSTLGNGNSSIVPPDYTIVSWAGAGTNWNSIVSTYIPPQIPDLGGPTFTGVESIGLSSLRNTYSSGLNQTGVIMPDNLAVVTVALSTGPLLPANVGVQTTPEPGTLAMAGLGAISALAYARRRSRK